MQSQSEYTEYQVDPETSHQIPAVHWDAYMADKPGYLSDPVAALERFAAGNSSAVVGDADLAVNDAVKAAASPVDELLVDDSSRPSKPSKTSKKAGE